jgi:hypothetical protein
MEGSVSCFWSFFLRLLVNTGVGAERQQTSRKYSRRVQALSLKNFWQIGGRHSWTICTRYRRSVYHPHPRILGGHYPSSSFVRGKAVAQSSDSNRVWLDVPLFLS